MTNKQILLRYSLPVCIATWGGIFTIGELLKPFITDVPVWGLVTLTLGLGWATLVVKLARSIYRANQIVNPILRRAANGRGDYEGSCRQKLSD